MGRFVFRLQKVLDHRVRVEDEKKRAFVKARLAYLKDKEKLDNLKRELDECNSKGIEAHLKQFQYIIRLHYIELLEERIEDQAMVVKVREDEMNSKRKEFEASQKDRKIIDKLKEKAQREYNISADRMEQKQNDEFALYGYTKK